MLGEQIRALRTARNLSQVQLAMRLGVTKQSVSNWENNNILPSVDMLKKIAQFFSCSTDYVPKVCHGYTIKPSGKRLLPNGSGTAEK